MKGYKFGLHFKEAYIQFLAHATEDPDRLIRAVCRGLMLRADRFEGSRLKGHFGNPVELCRTRLSGPDAKEFAENLFQALSKADKATVKLDTGKYVDEHGSLYLRFNKQLLFEGKLQLSQADTIRVKLQPSFRLKLDEVLSVYSTLLE